MAQGLMQDVESSSDYPLDPDWYNFLQAHVGHGVVCVAMWEDRFLVTTANIIMWTGRLVFIHLIMNSSSGWYPIDSETFWNLDIGASVRERLQ